MTPRNYQPTRLNGFVNFTFPNVTHPIFGTATVTGQFKRIKPHIFRLEVEPCVIEELSNKYCKLADQFGFRNHQFKRYSIKTIILTSIQTSLYWMPGVEPTSNEMDFIIRFFTWLWFLDDVMEEDWASREVNFDKYKSSELKAVHNVYLSIFRGNNEIHYDKIMFPKQRNFLPLCALAEDIVKIGKHILGECYDNIVEKSFIISLKNYLDSNQWFTLNPVDGRSVSNRIY